MDIVACTDKRFVMPTGVMIQSVCVNNPNVDIIFHIIVDDSVTSDDQHDLEEVVAPFVGKSVTFYHIDVSKFFTSRPYKIPRRKITKKSYTPKDYRKHGTDLNNSLNEVLV